MKIDKLSILYKCLKRMYQRRKMLSFILFSAVLLGVWTCKPVFAEQTVIPTTRLAGSNRYETALAISKYGWPDTSDYVVIATGKNFPDALSTVPLAKKYNAPVLLSEGNTLGDKVIKELHRLQAKNAFLIGGPGVISSNVENQLKLMSITPVRIYGKDRYETSVKIAEKLGTVNEVVVVNGNDFPGALFMAPIAAQRGIPILLLPQNQVPDSIKSYIKGKKITKSYLIGQQDLISSTVEKAFPNAERTLGVDKYERNLFALDRFASDVNYSNLYIATGEDFPDALAGSMLAAKSASPIILVNKTLTYRGQDFVKTKLPSISNIYLLGGPQVVSDISLSNSSQTTDDIQDKPTDTVVNSAGNFSGNLINGGLGAEQGNWIYYVNNGYLYRSTGDGRFVTIINADYPAYVNVIGQWVYYSNKLQNGSLYKQRTDGTEKTKLNEESSEEITVVGDWIYYTNDYDGGRIYKIKTDGSEKSKVNDDRSKYINVWNDCIYYSNMSDQGKLYKIKVNGTQRQKLGNDYVSGINVSDNWIYYSNTLTDGNLYKMKFDGTERTKLDALDGNAAYVKSINVVGGWVYYTLYDASSQTTLYRMKVDGTEKTKLITNVSDSITILANHIYYRYTSNQNQLYKADLDGSNVQKVS